MGFNKLLFFLFVVGVPLTCLVHEADARPQGRHRRAGGGNGGTDEDRVVVDVGDDFDSNIILENFGYLDDSPDHAHDEKQISKALEEFQRFNGLEVTGFLDNQTIIKMNQPRCGVADVIKPSERGDSTAPLAYHAPGYKWDSNVVSYKILNFTRQLNAGSQARAISNAFQKWQMVTPLTFRRSGGNADIVMYFTSGEHEDGPGNAFDGPGGTLAHAFFPGKASISGDTHFDNDEEWTLGEFRGKNLEIVAAHEFGHALGLGHSSHPSALMAPYYRGYEPDFKLHDDDIRGIQRLYGGSPGRPTASPETQPPVTTTTTTTTTTSTTTTTTPVKRLCDLKFDAIAEIHDGRTLIFSGKTVYSLTRDGAVNEGRIRRLFPRAPNKPRAVVHDKNEGYLYFFKGKKYWKFNGFQKLPGYPRQLPEPFHNVKAGLQLRDGRILLFKGKRYTMWREELTTYPSGYPKIWKGIPANPDGAFRNRYGYYFFFKGFSYWRFAYTFPHNPPGFPRDVRADFLNCQPESGGQTLVDGKGKPDCLWYDESDKGCQTSSEADTL